MHPLLQRQIEAATDADGKIDTHRLIGLIDDAYGVIDGPDGHADLDEWREVAKQRKEREKRYRDMAEAASDWFWETDADHRLTYISSRIAQVLGVKSSALLGTTFDDHGLEADAETARQHQDDLDARRPFRDRMFHAGPAQGADSRTLRISGRPVFTEDGAFTGYRGIGIDATREVAAEQQAGEARQILADAMESLSDGVAVFDSESRLVLANHRFSEVFDRDVEDLRIGMTFEELVRGYNAAYAFYGRDFEQWVAERVRRHREASGDPLVIQTTAGKWVLARDCRMASGGTVSVRTDITEIKRQELKLESLKRHYQIILDSAGEGIIGLDTEGRISFANRMACSMLQHGADALLGRSFFDLIKPRRGDGTPIAVSDSVITQSYRVGISCHTTDEVFLRADGQGVPVDYFSGPLMEGDLVTGAVLAFRDATLRLQYERAVADAHRTLEDQVAQRTQELSREVEIRARTEAALRESRTRMRGITDCLLEGVMVVSASGDVAFTNPAARQMLCPGTAEELEGLPMDSLVRLGGETPVDFAQGPWIKVAKGQETVKQDDATFLTADGRELSVAYACSPLAVDGGIPSCVILFRDIRELKSAQWDAMQASRMASVGQLAAGIAHEINTPTQYIGDNLRFVGSAMQTLADLIRDAKARLDALGGEIAHDFDDRYRRADLDYLLEEVPAALAQSEDGVRQVSRIVLSMKEFSHPGSSSRATTDINRALESTLTVTRNTWKHVAEVVWDLEPGLPHVLCFAGELNQVFLNLIVNAAHAIEEMHLDHLGVITVSTAREQDWVRISIADTGPGIPKAIRDKIFDPFFTTKPVGKGTGQGLAICRDVVVAKHKGRLDLITEEGKGATFVVRIPINAFDEEEAAKDRSDGTENEMELEDGP